MTARPDSLASSSTPRATSVKNGFATSSTTRPMVRLRPARSWRADSFLMKPRCLMAACTRLRVGSATTSGRLSTLETVPTETPAYAATSLMLTGALTTGVPPVRPVWGDPLERVKLLRPGREARGEAQEPGRAGRAGVPGLSYSSVVRQVTSAVTGRLCNDSTTYVRRVLTPT